MNWLNIALDFTNKGWAVIPIHSVNLYGHCSCGATIDYDPKYLPKHAIGKHPYLGAGGHREASKSEEKLKEWAEKWPDANIAIATGKVSNVVVLDVDKKNGGIESLDYLIKRFGELPLTPKVLSGGGGFHLYFKYPGFEVRGRRGMLPGLDVMADGGRIVAPPSKHKNKTEYKWDLYQGMNIPLSPLPKWLEKLILKKQSVTIPPTKSAIKPIRYVVTLDDSY